MRGTAYLARVVRALQLLLGRINRCDCCLVEVALAHAKGRVGVGVGVGCHWNGSVPKSGGASRVAAAAAARCASGHHSIRHLLHSFQSSRKQGQQGGQKRDLPRRLLFFWPLPAGPLREATQLQAAGGEAT